MNALDLLRNDHRRIIALLDQLDDLPASTDEESRNKSIRHLAEAIRTHQKMLRTIFNPELEKSDEVRTVLESQRQTNARIEEVLFTLEENKLSPEERTGCLHVLKQDWLTHVDQTESLIFPAAEKLLGAGRLLELFYEMDEVRTQQSGLDSAIYPASRLGPKR